MSLGLFSYFGYQLPLARRSRLIKDAGFTHTSIIWGPPEELFAAGKQDTIPDIIRNAGLFLENLHVPFENSNQIWSQNDSERGAFVERHLAAVKDAVRHDVDCLVLHVSSGSNAPGPTEKGLQDFRRIVAAAEDAGVKLAIENTRRDDILDFLMSRIASPALGFCYDSSHDWLWGAPRTGSLRRWGHRLLYTHFSDVSDSQDRHLLPCDGIIDWPQIADVFPRRTYRGILSVEVAADPRVPELPAAFLAKARERLEWIGDLLAP